MRPRLDVDQVATRCMAGLLVGQLVVVVLDYAIGGPGPFFLFGL
jgi:hypothetical protein